MYMVATTITCYSYNTIHRNTRLSILFKQANLSDGRVIFHHPLNRIILSQTYQIFTPHYHFHINYKLLVNISN